MKISYNWLKEHVMIDLEPEKLAEILTNTGLEVESFEKTETVRGGLHGVVIGKVLTCEKHPDADKLSVTTVDIGGGNILPIVCGAPNVAAGQIVPVATVGTTLYNNDQPFEIKKAKIRGEVSEGMICAEDELGLGESHEGIMVLPEDVEIGSSARDYFHVEEDVVFEIGLTPNRTDAMSHVGVARDLVAALNFMNSNDPLSVFTVCTDSFKVDNHDLPIEVIVEDGQACPRYSGVTMTGVEVKESPEWLKNRLLAIGLRPINNLVDISNYLLHETGQPTHFFDADKITGKKVIIKKLPKGTKFTTLDEVERELSGEDLMICNEIEGMCIAGVFGGEDFGVTENTKNIFIESAYFDPKTIRKTARYHGLNTDSSFRFERGADPNATTYVLRRAALMIRELAGGTVSSEVVDVYPKPISKWSVEVKYKNVDRLIGKTIQRDRIKDILIWLGMEIIAQNEDGLTVEVPTFKNDVTREADIIEEILRIYGYNNVEFPDQLRSSLSFIEKTDRERVQNLVADFLSGNGFAEIMNNSLTKASHAEKLDFLKPEEDVKIMNPLSADLGVMRQSLITSGLESIIYNLNRKNPDLKFYEFGNIYSLDQSKTGRKDILSKYHEATHLALLVTGRANRESWYQEDREADLYLLKFYVENILKRLNLDQENWEVTTLSDNLYETGLLFSHQGREVIRLGQIHKKVLKNFEIRQAVYAADINWDMLMHLMKHHRVAYVPVPKFPEVRRDLALVVDQSVEFAELKKLAFDTERNILKEVSLFDVYEGDKIGNGKKSYALSFILQDERKTLTDKVIDKTMHKILKTFESKANATLR
ncbi:MAG: phenylalanine--tRNA ligase subunit beta [Bacteroidales bacterium]